LPDSGRQVRTASAPATIANAAPPITALAVQYVPLRRWQRLQWQ
jgi:hypothetical protein